MSEWCRRKAPGKLDDSNDVPLPDRPVGQTIGYHLRSGKHDITSYDWARYLDFADRHFRKAKASR